MSVNTSVSKNVWHHRLGHPTLKVLEFVIKDCNLKVAANEGYKLCESCQFGKSHSLQFSLSSNRAKTPFELVHSDLGGSSHVETSDGCRYYVLFLDDYSRYMWLYLLKYKSETIVAFRHFLQMVQT